MSDENDLAFKVKQADKFIEQGDKVRIEVVIKGREYTHMDLVQKTFDRFTNAMNEKVKIEQRPKRQRLGMAMVVAKA